MSRNRINTDYLLNTLNTMQKFILTGIFLLLLVGLLYTPDYIPMNETPDQNIDYQTTKSDSTYASILQSEEY